MKTLIVYFSKFGNTQKIAETIAETLRTAGTVELVGADQLNASILENTDLVIMGTPTHNMNLPKAVRPVLDALPRRILRGIPVATFDTSYEMAWWLNFFTAAKRLAKRMRKLGGKRIIAPETFLVTDREGPLFDGELDRATVWAAEILGRTPAAV